MPKGKTVRIKSFAYSEVNFAKDETSRIFIARMITLICRGQAQWMALKQQNVAKSTCEAEYIAAADAYIMTCQYEEKLGFPSAHQCLTHIT